MLPIGRKLVEYEPAPPTQEQLEHEAEIAEKKNELYAIMQVLAPFPERKFFGYDLQVGKSAVVVYDVLDYPENVKMSAWVEREDWRMRSQRRWHGNPVKLKTQLIEIVGDKTNPIEAKEIRAEAHKGELSVYYLYGLPHEKVVEALDNIADTLQLIAEASSSVLV